MTTWRELFINKFVEPMATEMRAMDLNGEPQVMASSKDMQAFISLTIQSAFDEVEKTLPHSHELGQNEFLDINETFKEGYNQCLAEVKEKIKKIKEKFL